MMFKEDLCRLIIEGRKTQTRRSVKPGDVAFNALWSKVPSHVHVRVYAVCDGARKRWEVGKTYAVQPGRGKPGIAHIRLTAIRYCDHARAISHQDAVAEGFAHQADFCLVYADLNGYRALDAPCWALSFELAK